MNTQAMVEEVGLSKNGMYVVPYKNFGKLLPNGRTNSIASILGKNFFEIFIKYNFIHFIYKCAIGDTNSVLRKKYHLYKKNEIPQNKPLLHNN